MNKEETIKAGKPWRHTPTHVAIDKVNWRKGNENDAPWTIAEAANYTARFNEEVYEKYVRQDIFDDAISLHEWQFKCAQRDIRKLSRLLEVAEGAVSMLSDNAVALEAIRDMSRIRAEFDRREDA